MDKTPTKAADATNAAKASSAAANTAGDVAATTTTTNGASTDIAATTADATQETSLRAGSSASTAAATTSLSLQQNQNVVDVKTPTTTVNNENNSENVNKSNIKQNKSPNKNNSNSSGCGSTSNAASNTNSNAIPTVVSRRCSSNIAPHAPELMHRSLTAVPIASNNSSAAATSNAGGGGGAGSSRSSGATSAAAVAQINLNISTTTGGNFAVSVDPAIRVETLKKTIAKRLKVHKDRICLLYREKELQDAATLRQQQLMDGSRIILIPNVETGLLAQRPENTVMQALESLNDVQVNDFLSGKTPLNLSMRLGDHMMLIQLQLSTVNPTPTSASGGASSSSNAAMQAAAAAAAAQKANAAASSSRSGASTSAAAAVAASTSSSSSAATPRTAPTRATNAAEAGKRQLPATASAARAFPSASSSSSTSTSTHHRAHHRSHHRSHHSGGGASSSSLSNASDPNIGTGNVISRQHHEHYNQMLLAQQQRQLQYHYAQNASALAAGNAGSGTRDQQNRDRGGSRVSRMLANVSAAGNQGAIKSSDINSFLNKRDFESLQNIVKSIKMAQAAAAAATTGRGGTATTVVNTSTVTSANAGAATTSGISPAEKPSSSRASTSATPSSLLRSQSFNSSEVGLLEQSPIKSLSNLVSSPIERSSIKNKSISPRTTMSGSKSSSTAGPSAAARSPKTSSKTSSAARHSSAGDRDGCRCSRIPGGHMEASSTPCSQNCILAKSTVTKGGSNSGSRHATPTKSSCATPNKSPSEAALHKTTNNPISRRLRHHHHHKHQQGDQHEHQNQHTNHHHASIPRSRTSVNAAEVSLSSTSSVSVPQTPSATAAQARAAARAAVRAAQQAQAQAAAIRANVNANAHTAAAPSGGNSGELGLTDAQALAEASRSLTQTLRKLSKEVFTNKIEISNIDDIDDGRAMTGVSGAVIESMKNHGKGIYSGTFSGTLNPSLQDRYGRPKRDISTVIHILNDLLSAAPHCGRNARVQFDPPRVLRSSQSSSQTSSAGGFSDEQPSTSAGASNSHSQHGSGKHSRCLKCLNKVAATITGDPSATTNRVVSSTHVSLYGVGPRNTCCKSETDERARDDMCQRCLVDMENNKTKSKLEQLRLVMQQRKQNREARKLKSAPYPVSGGGVVGNNATATATSAEVTALSSIVATTPAASAAATSEAAVAPSEVADKKEVKVAATADGTTKDGSDNTAGIGDSSTTEATPPGAAAAVTAPAAESSPSKNGENVAAEAAPASATTTTTTATTATTTSTTTPASNEVSPNHSIVEEVDTAA